MPTEYNIGDAVIIEATDIRSDGSTRHWSLLEDGNPTPEWVRTENAENAIGTELQAASRRTKFAKYEFVKFDALSEAYPWGYRSKDSEP